MTWFKVIPVVSNAAWNNISTLVPIFCALTCNWNGICTVRHVLILFHGNLIVSVLVLYYAAGITIPCLACNCLILMKQQ